jgi:hypothetical protein
VGLGDPGPLQLDLPRELVEQPAAEVLLVELGAHERGPLVAGDLLGLREGTFDPVGDEREHGVRARGRRWVTTKHGTSPSGPLPPHAAIELS